MGDSERNLTRVGRVGKPHGVRGEIKIVPEIDDPHSLGDLPTLWLGATADQSRSHIVNSIRFQRTKLGITPLVVLAEIQDRDEAMALRNQGVFTDDPTISSGSADDYVVGLKVLVDGAERGTVQGVSKTSAHPILEIEHNGKTFLVPWVDTFIKNIDVDRAEIEIDPIPGLMEDQE